MRCVLPAKKGLILALLAAAAVLSVGHIVSAETMSDLRQAIEAKNNEIKKLEEEAAKYRGEIAARQTQARTLSGELARIDGAIAQLRREITLTQRQVQRKELEIRKLGLEIQDKHAATVTLQSGLGAVIRALSEYDRESLLATVVRYNKLSVFLRQFDDAAFLQKKVLTTITALRTLRAELEGQKTDAEKKQAELTYLQKTLSGQRTIQESEKKTRSELLALTKNQEKAYQKLLRDSEAKRAALEDEIRSIEEKIRVTIDPSSLPSRGTGVLGYPLPAVLLSLCSKTLKQDPHTNCLTQYFGNTSFAAIGAYNGKGHNGLDFRADIGTSVFAAEKGVITAVGDTDLGCRRASYGKWILVRHANNLSTLYTHLSAIGVSAGDQVDRGSRIGYSGMTGYATGPHLHFTVFATQGVQVEEIPSKVCGRMMTLPVGGKDPTSGFSSYLNPLDYL